MNAPETKDRRVHARRETHLIVRDLDRGSLLYAHDISEKGMLVTTQQVRWPGCMLRVKFRLPDAPNSIAATCRVHGLWDAPAGFGISLVFLKLNSAARDQILGLIRNDPSWTANSDQFGSPLAPRSEKLAGRWPRQPLPV